MVNNPATRASIHSGSGEIFFTCTSPVPRYVPGICNIWLCVQQKEGREEAASGSFPRPVLRVLREHSAARNQLAKPQLSTVPIVTMVTITNRNPLKQHGTCSSSSRAGPQGKGRISVGRPETEMY